MTLASPSYSEVSAVYPKTPITPLPECEPYKQVIRTLTDTVHAKDEAITALQHQVLDKVTQVEKVTSVAENAGSTDFETILVAVGAGLLGGFILGKVIK